MKPNFDMELRAHMNPSRFTEPRAAQRKRKNVQPSSHRDSCELLEDRGIHKIRRLEDAPENQPRTIPQGGKILGRQKDWRQILCEALNVSPSIMDGDLEFELDAAIDSTLSSASSVQSFVPPLRNPDPFYKILYRIRCHAARDFSTVYSDEPFLSMNDDVMIGSHLTGRSQISDLNRYIERNPGMSFVAIHEYMCCNEIQIINPDDRLIQSNETIKFSSLDLCSALNRLRDIIPNGSEIFAKFEDGVERTRLFCLLYHHTRELFQLSETVTGEAMKKHLMCFIGYLQQHKMPEFQKVDELFGKREVTRRFFQYLFIPKDVYVLKYAQGLEYSRGVQLVSLPTVHISWSDESSSRRPTSDKLISATIEFELQSWGFDGNFQENKWKENFTFRWEVSSVVPMSGLPILPFKFADEETQEMLTKRGNMFWRCRFHNYVSYSGWDFLNQEHFNDSRFVIDCRTHKQIAKSQLRLPQNSLNQSVAQGFRDDLGQTAMDSDEPPEKAFLLTLPIALFGFSMDDKRWRSLLVSRMSDVVWDQKAFHSLVLPEDTKDVIRALVTHRISRSFSTDIIRGKGSGLMLLFHGPPGTGKTLTAESVAEHAKKPLYRVTCGDIGTKPEAVERYLSEVLRLAKLWDCVVLLDEAEVFLQERSLTDLDRNALVSVFLRVLEYHDGILILTSNRVGTLDEGFRSRIQLALEYPKLDGDSRRRVWHNFIERLESDPTVAAEVDLSDLRRNLSTLSKYELNGREIRNAINVARPLASSSGTQVDFNCLKKVIGVQRRFDRYIKDMNEGLDDEKVAREEGKR
ncbi:hypothetical protein EDB81DRAFT_810137 [Dactylonectria macrodidyma]|uniref:AAA+ ATPase domain-containing protein n=1 Tax=Dactylonectria macrodidyma TaxID=307937 RepID=A0A9P9INT9_9HYPO|nr:hypothetical protein EDB81DRAFT_810137 [Dactylonectria macrodidyma]